MKRTDKKDVGTTLTGSIVVEYSITKKHQNS